eukprot:1145179-Pelagomonas_calceolata.AAC.4
MITALAHDSGQWFIAYSRMPWIFDGVKASMAMMATSAGNDHAQLMWRLKGTALNTCAPMRASLLTHLLAHPMALAA